MAWAEHHFAAAHRTVPLFRYVPTNVPTEGFPEDLQLETAKTCPYSLVEIPEYGHTIYQIFRRIHLLGIATSLRWKATRNLGIGMRVSISNMLLDVEYDMLVLSAKLGKDRKEKEPQLSKSLISICDVLVTASQIFLFVSLRALPVGARVVEIYLSRLTAAIRDDHLLESWNQFASYNALLWGLFMGIVAATHRPEKESIMTCLREVAAVLGIKSQDVLERQLEAMAWADFFGFYSADVAKELFRSRSVG